jgi:hypothetical protein
MVERGRIDWMIVILLKEWKGVEIVLGTWNLKKISQTFSGLVAQLFISLGVHLKIW